MGSQRIRHNWAIFTLEEKPPKMIHRGQTAGFSEYLLPGFCWHKEKPQSSGFHRHTEGPRPELISGKPLGAVAQLLPAGAQGGPGPSHHNFFFLIMAKYTSHKISVFNQLSVCSSIAFDSFMLLCDQFPELFSVFRIETLDPWDSNSPFLLSQAPRKQLLLSVSVSLTALGTSYKWNHTALVFLWLAYFT